MMTSCNTFLITIEKQKMINMLNHDSYDGWKRGD